MHGKGAAGRKSARSAFLGVVAFVFGLVFLAAIPLTSAGNGTGIAPVDQVLDNVNNTVTTVTNQLQPSSGQGTRSSGRRVSNAATSAHPTTEPPLHGTNPHGQGTVGVVDLSPSAERPQGGNPDGSDAGPEDVVIGRARGEQNNGTYHGHVTIAALFGTELLGVNSTPGQDNHGPLDALNQALGQLCSGSSICLTLLTADSQTTGNSSSNHFNAANVSVGGSQGIGASAADSRGDIQQSSNGCQNASGSSQAANVKAGGSAVASVAKSNTSSQDCPGQSPQQTSASQVIALGGNGVPLPAAGCGDGTPDTETGIPPLAPIVCNGDDTSQAAAPVGVRDALDVFVLDLGNTQLLKTSVADSESLARAQAVTTTPTTTTPGTSNTPTSNAGSGTAGAGLPGSGTAGAGNPGNAGTGTGAGGRPQCSDGIDNDGDGRIDFPNDPGCSSSTDDSEANGLGTRLAFTGADLLSLAVGGLLLLAGGLVLRRRLEPQPR